MADYISQITLPNNNIYDLKDNAALPKAGGIMTGTINRYYSTNSTDPILMLSTNNTDADLWKIGQGTSAGNITGNSYILRYNGTGSSPNKTLQLMAGTTATPGTVAIQINENGLVSFPATDGFTYSGMGTETTDIARPIWFMAASNTTTLITGRPVYSSNFKFNPSNNTLTIDTGTLSATEYSGNAATATEWADPQNVKVILGTQYGDGTGQSETAINGGQSTVQTIAVAGVLKISNGGTGANSVNAYGVVYGNSSADAYDSISANAEGQVFIGHGASGSTSAPSWYSGLLLTGAGTVASPYEAIFANDVSITGDLIVTTTTKLISNVGIGTDPDNNYLLYVNGDSNLNGDTIIGGSITITGNIIPSANNQYTLGSSTNNRWSALYIGTDDTYGDEYTPIYWYDGIPTEVAVVQKYTFSIANGSTTAIITPTNTNKARSIVTEIVVDSGIEYLNGPISWEIPTTGDNEDKIVLTTTVATSGAVGGYILVSIG